MTHQDSTPNAEVQPEKWVNLEAVAEHLSLSKDTVRNWIKEGKLPAVKVGKMYKFKLSEIDALARGGRLAEGGDDE